MGSTEGTSNAIRVSYSPVNEPHRVCTLVQVGVMVSSRERSTWSPTPVRRARRSAAVAATAAVTPPIHSPIRPPALNGIRPGWPRVAVDPAMAMRVNSLAVRWLHGPPRPKLDTETMVASGRRLANASQPTPRVSSSPGSDRSITRSAVSYRSNSRSRPSGDR